jgi:short-subunit dehydrogenase
MISKDLSERNAPKEVYDFLKKENIQIDYLINNAGFGGYGKFHERNWEDDQKMLDLNISALTYLTRLFLPDMVNRNNGRILNVASTAGFMPGPLQAVYYATKAYVLSFSQAIAEELHDTNITVTALCPGPVDTGFISAADLEDSKLFRRNLENSKDVAKKGYLAMAKGKLIEITQIPLKIALNIFMPFIPRKTVLKIVRKMQEK